MAREILGVLAVFVPVVVLGLSLFWKHQKMLRLLNARTKEYSLAEWNWWVSWTLIFFLLGIALSPGLIMAVFTPHDWVKWLIIGIGGVTALIVAYLCNKKANSAAAIFRSTTE